VTPAWMVRAGRNGEREQVALDEGLLIAGWEEVGDLTGTSSKIDIRAVVESTYPDASPARIANWTGQLWRVIAEIATGDFVVTPLRREPKIAIGRVAGEYSYRPDSPPGLRHVRKVEWIRTVPRKAVQQDLLDSMGSLLTVCRLERFGAAERIAALASSGVDPGPPGDDADTSIGSKRELAERAADSSPGEPLRISVRDLLAVWGAIRRSASTVAQIEEELTDLGLTTRPAFTDGGIDDKIIIVPVGEEPKKGDLSTSHDSREDKESRDFSTLAPRIGVIESANMGKVATVRPDDDIAVAVTKMIAHGYSQLAVVEGSGEDLHLRGAITWASIGTASVITRPKKVVDAMTRVRAVNNREFLLPLLEEIYRNEFFFVCSDESPLTGIVTAADLTKRFGQTTRPLILIEEAERRLRESVSDVFTDEDFKAAGVRYRPSSGMAPTIGNYVHLLKDGGMWLKLGWPIDHEFFKEHIEKLRVARNDFTHFNPDPLSDEQLEALEGFVRVLRAADHRD
jgi:restriction system protein